jgi:hypothetical protein
LEEEAERSIARNRSQKRRVQGKCRSDLWINKSQKIGARKA